VRTVDLNVMPENSHNNLPHGRPSPNRILIVDDEPFIRRLLTKYLTIKNAVVDTADNGEEALRKLEDSSYDLVLTDLKMPKMGGNELLKTMAERFPDIPKIVLTGYGTSEDIILALQTGAYDFLTKPITDFKLLDHSIRRAIERKRLMDERSRYLEQVRKINEIISMLNRGSSTEEIFNALNQSLKRIIPFDTLSLLLMPRSSEKVIAKLSHADGARVLNGEKEFSAADSLLQSVASRREILAIDDILGLSGWCGDSSLLAAYREAGQRSLLVLPLIVNDVIRGFLIFSAASPSTFVHEHTSFIESIGGQIAFSIERGELISEIEQYTKNLEHIIEIRAKEILKTQKTTIFALSKIAETRDRTTGYHLERIRSYCVLLAQLLKYSGHADVSNQFIRDLYDSSILHDVGKVGISDSILLKEGLLTPEETTIMEEHTRIGFESLKTASHDLGEDSFLKMAMDITLCHHERWDGSGYPRGLKGEEIPLSARIVAIADVYDALTTERPYKKAFSHEEAIEIMKSESHKYDPQLFALFIENANEFNEIRLRFQKTGSEGRDVE